MANFKTHIQFATIGSAAASTLLLNSHFISPKEALLCWVAGTIGGILPDIDSDNSYSLSILFGFFSLISCIVVTSYGMNHWPILWTWGACLITFFISNIVIREVFERFTVHRGIFHSLLAGVFFTFLVASIASFLGINNNSSWFLGFFTGFGFALHLLLDEIYAVNFMNVSLKRSFGSAFKLTSYSNWLTTAAFLMATSALLLVTPPHQRFSNVILNPQTYVVIFNDLIRLQ